MKEGVGMLSAVLEPARETGLGEFGVHAKPRRAPSSRAIAVKERINDYPTTGANSMGKRGSKVRRTGEQRGHGDLRLDTAGKSVLDQLQASRWQGRRACKLLMDLWQISFDRDVDIELIGEAIEEE